MLVLLSHAVVSIKKAHKKKVKARSKKNLSSKQ